MDNADKLLAGGAGGAAVSNILSWVGPATDILQLLIAAASLVAIVVSIYLKIKGHKDA